MKVTVIGAGKMGLPLACVFASRGAKVLASDTNPAVVQAINDGVCLIDEPRVPELLQQSVSEGRLRATTDSEEAISSSDVCVVIVPVLLTSALTADLSSIEGIAKEMSRSLQPGSMVVFETTLPVGQSRQLGGIIETGGLKMGVDFDLAFSPERVKSGSVLRQLRENPKVVGAVTDAAAARATAFYEQHLGAPVIDVGSLEAAELVKLAGMVYRDVNIALTNELEKYATHHGIDYETVRAAANTNGEAALLIPGIGVGGHCTPVYPHFLTHEARLQGLTLSLAETARDINDGQPAAILDRAGDLAGKTVLILGLSFRPGVKEAAYSPAFGLRDEIMRRGGHPAIHDPLFSDEELRALGFEPGPLIGNDVIVLNTAFDEYAGLDFQSLAQAGTVVAVDGRGLWNPAEVTAAGLRYVGVGRPASP